MGSQKSTRISGASLSLKTGNKLKRQSLFVKQKKAADAEKRKERFRRKKEEDKDPSLRQERLAKNQPSSIDKKRVWDSGDDDSLGAVVDLAALKRRRIEEEEAEALKQAEAGPEPESEVDDEGDEVDSMLDSDEDEDEDDEKESAGSSSRRLEMLRTQAQRDPSLAPSTTSTSLDLTPASIARKFPSLFPDGPHPMPKILVTTSLNATIHREAQIVASLFPNSHYVRRSGHRYAHKYSLREICKYSANREFTAVVMVREDQKKPTGLTIVHLPEGPTFHFTISNWIEGSKLPGHGNSQGFYPELLLNRFSTPLGMLTAQLFRSLFPYQPEIAGREVVSITHQRNYMFVRRHRYKYREKRQTERSVVDEEGKDIPGFSDIRVGLQEIGPRFTLKLRRVDKGVGRAGGDGDDALQWGWKPKMEKTRTRFFL